MTSNDTRVQRLLGLLYLAGILLAADQIADLISTILANPVALDSIEWRFGAFGLAASRVSVFLVADVMLFTAAVARDDRNALRLLGVVNLIIALALVVGVGLFGLDALQLRRLVRSGASRRYDAASIRAAGVSLLGVVLLVWSGIMSFRSSRDSKGARKMGAAMLIDGQATRGTKR
ncbi:MAG TPA: hypothetical protein VGQ17_03340 [Gemmatimonadales bacterium]|nr:hypothetical protein [Gemmatimonadales bacterium]